MTSTSRLAKLVSASSCRAASDRQCPSARTFLVIPRYPRQVQVHSGQAGRWYPSSARFDENRGEAKTRRAERIARREESVFLSRYRSTSIDRPAVDFFVLRSRLPPLLHVLLPPIPKHYQTQLVSYRAQFRCRNWISRYDAKSESSSLRGG